MIINGFDLKKNSTFIIAEACENHFGKISLAKEMILKSLDAGANCVKFQHHIPDDEMLKNVPKSDNFDQPLYEFLKENSFKLKDHEELKNFCYKSNITYLCTPFSLKAAKELYSIGCEDFKIGSGEMTDIPTLVEISKFAKNMIISTGMSTFDEIDRTYKVLKDTNVEFCFLNCTSEYPPIYEDLNLRVIPKMIERYKDIMIGHSDHTPEIFSSIASVVLGAKIVEKHVTLDRSMKGPDDDVSIEFKEFKEMVKQIRNMEKALGDKKIVNLKEKKIREWAFRSVVTLQNISKDQIISKEMVWSKRPGTGIPSYKINEVIGKKAKKDIKQNTLISWDDLN